MFFGKLFNKNGKKKTENPTAGPSTNLGSSLEKNVQIIKNIFNNDDTLVFRRLLNQQNHHIRCCIIFIDGMVNNEIINENVVQPIVTNLFLDNNRNTLDTLQYQVLVSNDVTKTSEVPKVIEAIINGDTILFLDGANHALIISSKGWQTRAITEPENEKVLRGPREGFTESLLMNLSMIRRKLKTQDLKLKYKVLGSRSNTKTCICYINGLASEAILNEFEKRLDEINIDGILGTGYIVEFIKDAPLSPFKTIGSTERPDVVAAKLLEGRIALLMDGSPVAITLPHLFIEYFQSNDDYYIHFIFSSISRVIRVISFFLSISVPAIYLALTTFHQEMIPTPLLLSISGARQGIPFPSVVELLALGLAFEMLRETGLRVSANIGNTLGIVGALILGQAAVQAKIVSAPMVIVAGLTAVTGLMIPRLGGAIISLRFIFTTLSAILGLYGYIFGIAGLLIHLCQIRSFGVPYLTPLNSLSFQDLKDTFIRAPWWYMDYRPKLIGSMNRIRQSKGSKTR
jgi:spore germination protein KA